MFGLNHCKPARVIGSAIKNVRAFGTAQMSMKFKEPTISVDNTQLFINGQFVDAVSGKTMPAIDPRTGKEFTRIAEGQKEDIDIAVSAARNAFENGEWARMSGYSRGKILNKLADLIVENIDILKELETLDVGKPLSYSQMDMMLCEEAFRYYAGWADKIHGNTIPCNNLMGKHFAYTLHEPIGVVGCILPWNFPLLMVAFQVAPALATGNTCVVKVAESTPLTALYFAKLCNEAGIPEGVFNVVPGYGETAGAALAGHSGVDKISFVGETVTGKLIMKAAADNLTPVTLELGGKSPSIVFDDADIDASVDIHQIGLFLNQGQCCTASSRIFVQESVYDEFVEKTVLKTKERTVGDPFTDVDQGPQQNDQQFNKVLEFIESGKNEGAKLLTGGNRIGNEGYFVEPTVFGDVNDDMRISREEIFGPVMQILKFKDTEEVISRANNTTYGLASGIMTSSIDRANYVSRALKAGTVWVNCYDIFDSSIPFGGYKNSGIGRVKGENALENFTQVKAVVHNLPNDGGWY